MKTCLYICVILFVIIGCTTEKEVDINLPDFVPSSVVESYLQIGTPFYLTLTNSVGFLDATKFSYIRNANVTISYNDRIDKLEMIGGTLPDSILGLNFQGFEGDSFFVYITPTLVPEDYESYFSLNIELPNGEELSAETFLPRPIPIDTVEWKFNADSQAIVIMRFQDPPMEENYYWYVRHKGTLANSPAESTSFDDVLGNGQQITLSSGFNYEKGDTIIVSLYHIPEDYYQFLENNRAAQRANLSPFGLPAGAYTNIDGGIGIFAGFSRSRKRIIIQ